jgi:Helicase conserved C-terminal domain
VARWAWQAPRRTGVLAEALLRAALDEGTWLGMLAAGAMSGFGRALLDVLDNEDDDPPLGALRAADKLEQALPAPVDHLLLQADLTAVAPGPLQRRLARAVALMADVESRGGATVYRFTPASIRRALDAGRTGDDLVALLTQHSRTEVPQPLTYLIMDSARRHGRLRVGTAQAYLRADDEAVLSEALADRRLGSLRLRRLAPTVLAAQAPPETVLRQLRESGYSPAAETPDGEVVVRRADEHRTPPRTKPRPLQPPTPARRESLLAAVPALRQADAAGQARTQATAVQTAVVGPAPRLTATDTASALALLRDAASRRAAIWVAHADAEGAIATRLLEPLRVDGGRLHARDRATDQLHTIAVARVTGVALQP